MIFVVLVEGGCVLLLKLKSAIIRCIRGSVNPG